MTIKEKAIKPPFPKAYFLLIPAILLAALIEGISIAGRVYLEEGPGRYVTLFILLMFVSYNIEIGTKKLSFVNNIIESVNAKTDDKLQALVDLQTSNKRRLSIYIYIIIYLLIIITIWLSNPLNNPLSYAIEFIAFLLLAFELFRGFQARVQIAIFMRGLDKVIQEKKEQ